MPGESLGKIRKELAEEFGFDMEVVLPCTHDTASAILAVAFVMMFVDGEKEQCK